MKKFLSVICAMSILAASFLTVPMFAGAADTDDIQNDTYTHVDFSEDYYEANTGDGTLYSYNYAQIVDDPDTASGHGKVAKFTKISQSYSTGKTVNNNRKWPQLVRIADSSGTTAFKVTAGETYKVKWSMKRPVTQGSAFNVGVFVTESQNLILDSATKLADTVNRKDYYVSATTTTSWANWFAVEFTAAKSGTIAMMISKSGGVVNNVELYIDDVIVEKAHNITVHNLNGPDTEPVEKAVYAHAKIASTFTVPTSRKYTFEGWYLDAAYTQKADELIGNTSELYAHWVDKIPDTNIVDFELDLENFSINADNQLVFTPDGASAGRVVTTRGTYSAYDNTTQRGLTQILETTDNDGKKTQALNFTGTTLHNSRWPAMAYLYDSRVAEADRTTDNYPFKPLGNSVYTVTFKYRVDKDPNYNMYLQLINTNNVTNPFSGGYTDANVYSKDAAVISDATEGWVETSVTIVTPATPNYICIALVSSTVGTYPKNIDVWVDDVRIVEELNVAEIKFESNGGNAINSIKGVIGKQIHSLPVPEKAGNIFAGWYTDSALTNGFNSADISAEEITLYAKWQPVSTEAKEFETGFEAGSSAYTNYNSSSVSDNYNESNVIWYDNDAANAYTGTGYLKFDNTSGTYTSLNSRWLSAALTDAEGNYYQLVAGQRYKLSFNYRFSGNSKNSHSVYFGTSSAVPSCGINNSNISVMCKYTFTGNVPAIIDEWGSYESYFVATESEKAVIVVNTPYQDQTVEIDDIAIVPADTDEIVVVSYYYESGTTLLESRIGAPGDKMIGYPTMKKDGFVFDGWIDENGVQFKGNYFPASDLKLVASWREANENPDFATDLSSPITVDFEDDDALAFYQDASNTLSGTKEVIMVTGDADNAHSGDSYLKFNGAGQWTKKYYRTAQFYNPDSPDNKIWLEPNTSYRITYWIMIEDTGTCNLYLAGFNPEVGEIEEDKPLGWTVLAENYLTDADAAVDGGKWVQIESLIITDEVPVALGFVLYGGYLTANIDDIVVQKRENISVSFETNGGGSVSPITQLSYGTVMAPVEPERDGYDFDGWYTDKELTKKFKFNETIVTENITLYAKWIPWTYETVTTYNEKEVIVDKEVTVQKEVTVDKEITDPQLDEQFELTSNDAIGKVITSNTDTNNDESTGFPWWIIIVIVAALIVIAVGIFLIIIAKKRRKGGI